MRILVNDWAWINCVQENAPASAVKPWGYAIAFEGDSLVSCYYALDCNKLRETEKAVQFEYKAVVVGRNCDPTGKVLNWKVWIPKSCIVSDTSYSICEYFNGGEYELVEFALARLAKEGYSAKYSRIVKGTSIPIVKSK